MTQHKTFVNAKGLKLTNRTPSSSAESEDLDDSSQFHEQRRTAGRDQNLLRLVSGFSEVLLWQPIMELGFGPGTNQWPHLPPRPTPSPRPRPPLAPPESS